MSQIDELYNNLSEEEIAEYSAGAAEEERHIVVNADRSVTVPDELKRIAVQYDHDVETVTFDCPRYWDGLDMSLMAVYINYLLPGGKTGSYPCKKVIVDSTNKDIMHFDWTISGNVTPNNGQIRFLVCVKKTNSEGNLVNHWNSELCDDCYISEGLEAEAIDITVEYPDVVTQLLLKMDEITDKIPDVDEYLTIYSTNPVQNKVIAEEVLAFKKNFVDLRNQYWEAGTIDGIYSDTDIREKMTAAGGALWIKNKIWRLTFDATGDFGAGAYRSFAGHDVIGIPYNAQGLYIIDMTTGKTYTYEVTDGWTDLTPDVDIPDVVTDAGIFNTLEELTTYTFAEDRSYKIFTSTGSSLATLLGATYGQYWSALYWVDRSDGNLEYLTLTSLDDGRVGRLCLDNGSWEEFTPEYGAGGSVDVPVKVPETPLFANGISEMTDTSKVYVSTETGTFWVYKDATSIKVITEQVDEGYTYPENSRLGSDGSVSTSGSYAGYTVTPFIDLQAYAFPFTLHLDGCTFAPATSDNYSRMYAYNEVQEKIGGGNTVMGQINSWITIDNSNVTQDNAGNTAIVFDSIPNVTNTTTPVRFLRFSGKIATTPNVYVTYEDEVTSKTWVDTEIAYAPNITEDEKQQIADDIVARIDTELLSVLGSGEVI